MEVVAVAEEEEEEEDVEVLGRSSSDRIRFLSLVPCDFFCDGSDASDDESDDEDCHPDRHPADPDMTGWLSNQFGC